MWKIACPPMCVEEVLEACGNALTDPHAAAELLANRPAFVLAETDYRARGVAHRFVDLMPTPGVNGIGRDRMIQLYDRAFSRRGSPVRTAYYDRLKLSAPHGVCPSCGERPVASLDHYLPKTSFPAYAVTPINLVPCCSDCNKTKSTFAPLTPETQLLHPYFDDVEDAVWLKAELVPGDPPGFSFYVDCPPAWGAVKRSRVEFHFQKLNLAPLFSAYAGRLMGDVLHRLRSLWAAGGPITVREYLLEEADTRRQKRTNSWQIASYVAMADSAPFCADLRL